jgi:3'-phosphoadenosine 5'-phosphosulfate sulfotransferase (PAPS reductase)/FAD synthetase
VVKIIVNNVILDHPTMLVIMAGFQVKKQDSVLLALFRDILKTLIIYLMVDHGVNMNGKIIALLQNSELLKGIVSG